jgi:hypothetical protein
MLPNIRDGANSTLIGLTQGNLVYVALTLLFNDFLRRFRQHLTYDLQCVRFIGGLANFQLKTQAKSRPSQDRGYTLPSVELKNLLNDRVTDSPHMGHARTTTTRSTTPRGGHPIGNDLMTILWSRRQNVGNEESAQGLVEVVDVVTIVVVVM